MTLYEFILLTNFHSNVFKSMIDPIQSTQMKHDLIKLAIEDMVGAAEEEAAADKGCWRAQGVQCAEKRMILCVFWNIEDGENVLTVLTHVC